MLGAFTQYLLTRSTNPLFLWDTLSVFNKNPILNIVDSTYFDDAPGVVVANLCSWFC